MKRLFEKVESEQGRLDVLVNNAFSLGPGLQLKTKFWQQAVGGKKLRLEPRVYGVSIIGQYALLRLIVVAS